jgi:hypothetical protein
MEASMNEKLKKKQKTKNKLKNINKNMQSESIVMELGPERRHRM